MAGEGVPEGGGGFRSLVLMGCSRLAEATSGGVWVYEVTEVNSKMLKYIYCSHSSNM